MAISFVNASTNFTYDLDGTFVVNKPTNTAQGDVMFTAINTQDAAPFTVPSGWTLIGFQDQGTVMRTYLYWKAAGASEPSTYSWTLTSSATDIVGSFVVHSYRGVNNTTPYGSVVGATSASATTLGTGNITIAQPDSWLMWMSGCRHVGSGTSCSCTSTDTERSDGGAGDTAANFSRYLATYDSNGVVAPGTTSRSLTRTGTPVAHNVMIIDIRADTFTRTDTGAGAESQTISAAQPSSDTGTSAEANSITASQTRTDTGTGTEGAPSIATTRTDTGTGAEAQSVNVLGTDTGTGVESQSISASQTQTDTGSGASAQSITANLSGSDTGTSTEGQSVAISILQGDTGTGTESQALTAAQPGSETASGTSGQSLAVSLPGADTGTGTEGTPSIGNSSADTGTGASNQSIAVGTTGSDTGSAAEGQIIYITSADLGSLVDANQAVVSFEPPAPGDWSKTLLMGPAEIWIGAYGAVEPANGAVASDPDTAVWTNLGHVSGGVELTITEEYESVELMQVPGTVFRRLKKRHLAVKTLLAEPTLVNLAYALNDNTSQIVTGSGYQYMTPGTTDEATPLTYRALIIRGWHPGMSNNRHKRRTVIIRKALSTDQVQLVYTKDGQSTYSVNWSSHYVDGTTAPFKIIDAT